MARKKKKYTKTVHRIDTNEVFVISVPGLYPTKPKEGKKIKSKGGKKK